MEEAVSIGGGNKWRMRARMIEAAHTIAISEALLVFASYHPGEREEGKEGKKKCGWVSDRDDDYRGPVVLPLQLQLLPQRPVALFVAVIEQNRR